MEAPAENPVAGAVPRKSRVTLREETTGGHGEVEGVHLDFVAFPLDAGSGAQAVCWGRGRRW